MERDWLEKFGPLLARLRTTLRPYPELCGWLGDIGQALSALVSEESAATPVPAAAAAMAPVRTEPVPETNGYPPTVAPIPPPRSAEPPRVSEPMRSTPSHPSLFRPPVEGVSHSFRPIGVPAWTDIDLSELRDRCRLKAEGARWAADRRRAQRGEGPTLDELTLRHSSMIERARAVPECFLWMVVGGEATSDSPEVFDRLAVCFDVVADAADLLYRLEKSGSRNREDFTQMLHLSAEAQSALRNAVFDSGREKDPDQVRLFVWVKEAAQDRQVWIARYMRMDDPADPAKAGELRQRFAPIEARLSDVQNRVKKKDKNLKNLAYKLKLPANERDWPRIFELIDELLGGGLPPSDIGLRDLILPVRSEIPETPDLPASVRLVVRELDRYLELRSTSSAETDDDENAAYSDEVRRCAELLEGKAIVLIGGTPSPPHQAKLESAFGLKELIWIETREHQTHVVFEPEVARPDVALVILAIRWSSHGFGEVKDYCEKYDKPLVFLPRGYNPNQVASEIVKQALDRLTVSR